MLHFISLYDKLKYVKDSADRTKVVSLNGNSLSVSILPLLPVVGIIIVIGVTVSDPAW